MEQRRDESFRFMERLLTTWLERAHHMEITRVLALIKAEMNKRGLDLS